MPWAGRAPVGITSAGAGRALLPFLRRTRASSFVPTDIPGLQLWLKADGTLWQDSARTTPATANNDPVGAWDDASGNANYAIQATAGFRPLLKTSVVNSKPVVRFDGTDDFLAFTATLVPAPVTVFVVLLPADSGVNTLTCGLTASLQYRIEGYKQRLVKCQVADMGFSSTAMSSTLFSIIGFTYSSPDAAFRLNGAADGTLSSAQTFTLPETVLGKNVGAGTDDEDFAGDIAELLYYDSVLSGGNIASVEAFLNAKYAIY